MTTQTITLPMPPSLNNAFSQTRAGRRFPSSRYKRWRAMAYLSIKAARLVPVAGPAEVCITLHAKDRRRRDADNLIKPVVDSLVATGVLADDDSRHVRTVSATWAAPDRINPRAVVVISPWKS